MNAIFVNGEELMGRILNGPIPNIACSPYCPDRFKI